MTLSSKLLERYIFFWSENISTEKGRGEKILYVHELLLGCILEGGQHVHVLVVQSTTLGWYKKRLVKERASFACQFGGASKHREEERPRQQKALAFPLPAVSCRVALAAGAMA